MPIFEYQCQDCQVGFEVLLKNRQSPRPSCPRCGSKNVKKQLSGFSVGSAKSATHACEACPGGACPSMGQGCEGGCPLG